MNTIALQPKQKIEQEQKKLLDLLLQKVGFNYKQLVDFTVREWIADHTALLTNAEKKQFKTLILN